MRKNSPLSKFVLLVLYAFLAFLSACSSKENSCPENFKDYGDGECKPIEPCIHWGTCEAQHRRCVNNQGIENCGDCLANFQDYGDGNCKPDPCLDDTNCKMENRKCFNSQGVAICGDCIPGYHLENNSCVANIRCEANSCSQHGSCDDSTGLPVCTCNKEYKGDHCEDCSQGYSEYGDGECKPIDPCVPNPCSEEYKTECANNQGDPFCSCDKGYELNNQNECVRYEYQCNDNKCGSDAMRRQCRGDTCGAFSLLIGCDSSQVCWANQNGAGCTDCELGCVEGRCQACKLDSGSCCDDQGQLKNDDVKCEEWTEYKCIENCGGTNRFFRVVARNCPGDSPKCTGNTNEYSWIPMSDCSDDQGCEIDDKGIAQCVSCIDNSSCVGGVCTCHFESCSDACCVEDEICRWNGICGLNFTAEAKLVASDRDYQDFFGKSVSISGSMAIVGSPYEDGGDGDPLAAAGAAYIFQIESGKWVEKQKLTASDAIDQVYFGYSVSISGNMAVVGAPRNNAAYIFHLENGEWIEKQKLTASDLNLGDWFGGSVSIDGEIVVIGASMKDEERSNGEHIDEAGAAYIFQLDNGRWEEKRKLTASVAQRDSNFGASVSIDGDVVVVGAPHEYSSGTHAGAAYVFQSEVGGWSQKQKLIASDSQSGDMFGISVSISGSTAVIGALYEDGGEGNPSNGSGAAYIFQLDNGQWKEKQKLYSSDSQSGDGFGNSVSICDGLVIIGAASEGRDPEYPNSPAGAAYIFKRENEKFVENMKLTASDRRFRDLFGTSVSISGNFVIIGSPGNHEGLGYPYLSAGAVYFY